jgi:hypothetical protein
LSTYSEVFLCYIDIWFLTNIQASIPFPPHESKGLICYTPFQDFEFYDTSFSNLEKENLMDKPLFDEEHDNKEIENIDSLLHIERHK